MTRRNIVRWCLVLGFAAALPLGLSWAVKADAEGGREGRINFAGIWVGTDDQYGAKGLEEVVPTDPTRGEFIIVANDFQGEADFAGMFPTAVARSEFRGPAIRTGPRTLDFTLLAYATDKDHAIVYIMNCSGTIQFLGPDTAHGTMAIGIYSPDQDPLGDEAPAYMCLAPWSVSYKRMPVRPPCVP